MIAILAGVGFVCGIVIFSCAKTKSEIFLGAFLSWVNLTIFFVETFQ